MTNPEKNTQEMEPNKETVNFKNSRGLNLVGDLHHTNSESIIIMSHGLAGDRHEGGRFDKAANEFNQAGYNVFKFDFSGSGESQDDILTPEKEIDDLESVLRLLKERGFKNFVLLGLSFGGYIS